MNELLTRLRSHPAAVAALVAVLLVGLFGIAQALSGAEAPAETEPVAVTDGSATPTSGDASPSSTSGAEGQGTGAGGMDNSVVLINRQDGRWYTRAGFGTARVTGDVVDNQNTAYAYSSCTDCRTVAVAVQIVLAMGNPNIVTPGNYAIAINHQCSSCRTMAAAYQYVITTDGIVRFTAEGEARMAQIRNEISAVTGSDLSFPEIDARLDALVAELWQIVDEELVKVGVRGSGTPRKDRDVAVSDAAGNDAGAEVQEQPDASESPASGEETADPSPSPTATPTTSPSPSPTP